MQRRTFLKNSSLLMGGLPFLGLSRPPAFRFFHASKTDVFELTIGEMKCTIFQDTLHTYKADRFFTNAAPQDLQPALDRYRVTPDKIPSPFIALLVHHKDKKVLVDTGQGFVEKPVMVNGTAMTFNGRLHHLLQREKIKTGDITDVVLTHLHPDHIGGIYSEEKNLLFPNARFHIHEDEWQYWHTAQSVHEPAMFKYFIEKNVTKLKGGNLNLVRGDFVDLLPGITAVKADGHTPGQLALVLHSQKNHLLYISDAFLHPLHMERLDWQTNYDLDHDKAKATRIKLLDLAYKENMLLNAFHFHFPGLGRVDKMNNHWTWRYTNQ